MIIRDVVLLTIQGDTERTFVGTSLDDAQRRATAWIEAEHLIGYLSDDVRSPKITSWSDWDSREGSFYYDYFCNDSECELCVVDDKSELVTRPHTDSWDNWSAERQTLIFWD